ncbi:riboflavin biosynthesis protein RibD [Rhodobacteraceae bacterium RKSG542]|uniref:RibD family protein n=1 Tax=Pseudovibrio flavus TaxID=2529854 RepID=UPI0012BCA43F|nr:dihydrofolate reductase family protein [Pseudovibrio flavus]MTI17703.1 riboflavin biosynthesis protein RibD [Pseudovibrio flavus]
MDQQSQQAQALCGSMSPLVWEAVKQAQTESVAPKFEGYPQSFAPLCTAQKQFFIGQLGQSVDGRIATETGHSYYINCPEALDHLHCLRALCDAVIIGVETAICDNPQLTVRRVSGQNPARIIIDPKGRLPSDARLLQTDDARRIVVTMEGVTVNHPSGVEHITLPVDENGRLCCKQLSGKLSDFKRILVEGGAWTLSRFLAAGLLDRLHLMVAPMIIGAGPTGIQLPPIQTLDEAIRPKANWYHLGCDVLLDLDLRETNPKA